VTLADLVGVVRAVATIPIALAILVDARPLALLLFAAAAASDGLDGWLARRTGTVTARGALLDPMADKVLVTGVAAALAVAGELDVWLVSAVTLREVIVAGLRAAAYARAIPIVTGREAKAKTALEMIGVALAVAAPGVSLAGGAFLVTALVIGVLTIPHYVGRPIHPLA